MLKRGIDDNGQVSNFVETEQLLWDKTMGMECLFSFVQVAFPPTHSTMICMGYALCCYYEGYFVISCPCSVDII